MKKQKINEGSAGYVFRTHKSYSVDEILKAGGTTAFANKIGKSAEWQREAWSKLTPIEFTDEEWDSMMEMIQNDK